MKWYLPPLFSLFLILGNTPIYASGIGEFYVGAFESPQIKPVDYNTNATWATIAAANIDRMVSIENSGSLTYNKTENENAIANSKLNNVGLMVTDLGPNGIYDFQSYTAADYAVLESRVLPYKNDARVFGLSLKDEPYGYNLEGYANTFKHLQAFAPDLHYYVNLQPQINERYLHSPRGKLFLSNSGASGTGSYVSSGASHALGQTFVVPAGMTVLDGIDLKIDPNTWASNETLTLTLWNYNRTVSYASSSITGSTAEAWQYYPYFTLNVPVTAGSTYYWELTHNGGGNNSVGWVTRSATDVYNGGQAYSGGFPIAGSDFWFRLYEPRPITPRIYNNASGDGGYVSSSLRLGQTFTTPSNVNRRLYYMQVQLDAGRWTAGQSITLTLWDSPSKTVKIAENSMNASNNGNYPVFYLNARLTSNTSYYYELTSNSTTSVGWVTRSTNDVYSDGAAYLNGSMLAPAKDYWFKAVFGSPYEYYLDDWLDYSGSNELLFDIYPFKTSSDDPTYFLNLEQVRERGLDHDVIYGNFLQNWSNTRHRNPTLNEKRYNVYTNLTYGMKMMYWFTYWRPIGNFNDTAVDYDGTILPAYAQIQGLNAEMRNLGGTLKNLTSQQVYHTGTSLPMGTVALPSTFFIKPANLSLPLIEGYFTDPDGRKYLMLTNRDYNNTQTNITFNFSPAMPADVTEISKTTGAEVALVQGTYTSGTGALTVTLQPGEGRLFALPAGY